MLIGCVETGAESTVLGWELIGYLGQAVFGGRWLVQWLVSEKAKQSVVPAVYWYMSLFGGLITLSYAIFRETGPFIVAQSCGVIVYLRNIVLLKNTPKPVEPPSAE